MKLSHTGVSVSLKPVFASAGFVSERSTQLAFSGKASPAHQAREAAYEKRLAELERRTNTALDHHLDMADRYADQLTVSKVSVEEQDSSRSLRFDVALPNEADTFGLQLGIGFNGTTGLFGRGKPIISMFGFFYTLREPGAQDVMSGRYETIWHSGLYTLPANSKSLDFAQLKPYTPGRFHRAKLALERMFMGAHSIYEDHSGRVDTARDKRVVDLATKLLAKTERQTDFVTMLNKLKTQFSRK